MFSYYYRASIDLNLLARDKWSNNWIFLHILITIIHIMIMCIKKKNNWNVQNSDQNSSDKLINNHVRTQNTKLFQWINVSVWYHFRITIIKTNSTLFYIIIYLTASNVTNEEIYIFDPCPVRLSECLIPMFCPFVNVPFQLNKS